MVPGPVISCLGGGDGWKGGKGREEWEKRRKRRDRQKGKGKRKGRREFQGEEERGGKGERKIAHNHVVKFPEIFVFGSGDLLRTKFRLSLRPQHLTLYP